MPIRKSQGRADMNRREIEEYVEELQQYESMPGMNGITRLCEKLGNPQKKLKCISITATNGKGSIQAFVSSILKSAGYKVGSYCVPALADYRENFRINGKMITWKALGDYLEQVKQVAEEMIMEKQEHPTTSEIETAVAFLYFAKEQCDLVVLTTQTGEVLDTDSVIQNEIDKKIASPKPVSHIKYGLQKPQFDYAEYKKIEIGLAGNYQIENAAAAIGISEVLMGKGYTVSETQLRRGLLETRLAGRFQILARKPFFIADGAYTPEGARRLVESVQYHFCGKKAVYIIGVLRDSAYEKMLEETHVYAEHIITVTVPGHAKALSSYELALAAKEYHGSVTVADSLQEAVEISYLLADKETVIIAFGSLYFMGDLIRIVEKK